MLLAASIQSCTGRSSGNITPPLVLIIFLFYIFTNKKKKSEIFSLIFQYLIKHFLNTALSVREVKVIRHASALSVPGPCRASADSWRVYGELERWCACMFMCSREYANIRCHLRQAPRDKPHSLTIHFSSYHVAQNIYVVLHNTKNMTSKIFFYLFIYNNNNRPSPRGFRRTLGC